MDVRLVAHVAAHRPMDDSVNWQAIPVGMPLVAGYVPPSRFAWPLAAWARFAGSTLIRITPSASVVGRGIQVLDVETGDATPAQVPGWVAASRRAGQEPTAYMTVAAWPAVIRACTAARVAVPQFWVAAWDGRADLPSITVDGVTYTAVAHQLADPPASGGDFDRSVVAAYWPGVDPAPAPHPAPPIHRGDDMVVIECDELSVQAILSGGVLTPLDPTSAGPANDGGTFPRFRVIADVFHALQAASDAITGTPAALAALTAAVKAIPAAAGGVTAQQLAEAVRSDLAASLAVAPPAQAATSSAVTA